MIVRTMFVCYLLLVIAGLIYFVAVGLRHG
jgi:hypothetical protein